MGSGVYNNMETKGAELAEERRKAMEMMHVAREKGFLRALLGEVTDPTARARASGRCVDGDERSIDNAALEVEVPTDLLEMKGEKKGSAYQHSILIFRMHSTHHCQLSLCCILSLPLPRSESCQSS